MRDVFYVGQHWSFRTLCWLLVVCFYGHHVGWPIFLAHLTLTLTKWWLSFNDWPLAQSSPDWFRYFLKEFGECLGHWQGRLGTGVRMSNRQFQALALPERLHSGSTSTNYMFTCFIYHDFYQYIMAVKGRSWTPLLFSMTAVVAPPWLDVNPKQRAIETSRPRGSEEMSVFRVSLHLSFLKFPICKMGT